MRHCSCDPLGRKNSATSTAQIDQVRPVAHPPKPHSGLGDKVGDLWVAKATHHSPPHSWKCVLNQQQQFAASGECNELRRVAARRVGWQRTARLCESQKLGQMPGHQHSSTHHPNSSPKLGPARLENRSRFSSPKNRHVPKLAPTLRPVSASLRLRCRSAAFSYPLLCPRAGGNLIQTHLSRLNDFLLQHSRADGL